MATRRLGYRHLWIDALCIIQDDENDWRREALQMPRIYQDAFCTLAAAGSDSSTGGLFVARGNTPLESVAIPYTPEGSAASSGVFFISHWHDHLEERVQQSTWNSRGWVLQERTLSRRTILFAKGQTFFECARQALAEDGRDHMQTRYGNTPSTQTEEWRWCLLVEEYTRRSLKEPKDKLYAILGLAENAAHRANKTYCAGLWCENLQLHVLWYSWEGTMEVLNFQRAPSWSWAAHDGRVSWEPSMNGATPQCIMTVPFKMRGLDPNPQIVAQSFMYFQGVVLPVRRSAHTFAVEGGYTESYGDVLVYMTDLQTHPSCHALLASDGHSHSGTRIGWAVFDLGDVFDGPLHAAHISDNIDEYDAASVTHNVLILKKLKGENQEYTRVGMGEIIQNGWFNGQPSQTIVLR